MPPITETAANPAEQAHEALRALLVERPEFTDTKRNTIRDIIPFLEDENGFPAWLDYYENNMRSLSNIWAQVARQLQSNPQKEVVEAEVIEPEPVKNEAPAPVVEATLVTPEPEPAPAPAPKKKAAPAKSQAKPSTNGKSKEKAASVEEGKQVVVVKEIPPAVLEEQVVNASRALAEQFAIVKHHEIALQQAARTIEEANEALNRARQAYANSTTAYTNALEDLARMMASSLGSKASDFSKLVARAASSDSGKSK